MKAQKHETDWYMMEKFTEVVKDSIHFGTLREIIRLRETNGAHYFCRKLGKRLLLSPTKFFEWIEMKGRE